MTGHPNTSDDVILNETTNRVTRCGHEVLIVVIGDEVGLGTGDMVF